MSAEALRQALSEFAAAGTPPDYPWLHEEDEVTVGVAVLGALGNPWLGAREYSRRTARQGQREVAFLAEARGAEVITAFWFTSRQLPNPQMLLTGALTPTNSRSSERVAQSAPRWCLFLQGSPSGP